tara:strand:- start:20 stop:934 length:915 start_codon:yes stop_codon:yes gene_type:complete
VFRDLSNFEEAINHSIRMRTSIEDAITSEKIFKSFFPLRNPKKKTAYLIGTGPSLKKIDVSRLKNHDTITFNRAYVAFDDWGFDPTYYLAIDSQDLLSISHDIKDMMVNRGIKHYFLPHGQGFEDESYKKYNDKITLLKDTPESWKMVLNFSEYVFLDKQNLMITPVLSSAGYMGLKMLYLMGYQEVALLGCDARYRTDEESQKSITWDEDGCVSHADYDPNHFRDDYFGKGQRFGRPIDEDETMKIWTTCLTNIQAHSQIPQEYSDLMDCDQTFKVYSCSEGSLLNSIFPYVDFKDFMNGKRE